VNDVVSQTRLTWHWPVLVAIISLYLTLAYLIPPGADTLWRLHIARGLLDGQVLYRDMIEVNPPLWFWGAMPAAALGGYPALVGINLVASLLGVGLFGALVRLTDDNSKTRWSAMVLLAMGLLLVTVAEIGQREQAFLLACALWSGLAAARIEGKSIPIWLALGATFFAAYGFALKHYFVLVPICIEVMMIAIKRRLWTPFRIETVVLAALALAYALAVIYLTPDFLGRVLDLVQASYYGFGPWNSLDPAQRLYRLVLQCHCISLVFAAVIAARRTSVLVRVLLLSGAIAVVIVLLQQKGWRYHLISANGLGIIIIGLIWRTIDRAKVSVLGQWTIPLVFWLLIGFAIALPAFVNLKTKGQPINAVLASLVAREPPNHHIAILSTAPDNAFFPLARAKRDHWSRHYSMWMMPGLLTPQREAKNEARRLQQRAIVLSEFTADLTCRPPDLIVGEVGYFRNPKPKLFDAMAFLREDPVFSDWMQKHYRRVADQGDYPVWRLLGAKPAPLQCTKQP
jgi:hypothetical protein